MLLSVVLIIVNKLLSNRFIPTTVINTLIPVTDWIHRGNVKLPAASGLIGLMSCDQFYVAEMSQWPLEKHALGG